MRRATHGGIPVISRKQRGKASVAAASCAVSARTTARRKASLVPSKNTAHSSDESAAHASLGRSRAPHAATSLVLGIDPGLANLGWALIEWSPTAVRFIAMGTLFTKPPRTTQERCELLWIGLDGALASLGCAVPELVVIEEQSRAWQGKQKEGKTNANATKARVGEGLVRGWAIQNRAKLLELTPYELRKGIGVGGHASKELIARMACLRSRAPSSGHRNHATDALGLAVAGAARWSVLKRLYAAQEART